MLKILSFRAWLAFVGGLLAVATVVNAAPVYKCKVNGSVTYQQDPCPSGQVRKPPTVQELNATEKKRRETVTAATPATPATPATTERPEKPTAAEEKAVINPQRPEKFTPTTSNPPTASTLSSSFSCDGRKHCTQMKSCAEAKYFLANCPGVKMDGDKDGIPCEEQWCSR